MVTSNHGQEFNETQSNSWGYDSNYSTYQVQVPWCWPGLVPNLRPRRRRAATWIWYRP